MPYVNKNEVLSIFAKVNAKLGIEEEPLFVENMTDLVQLITSAFSGQLESGKAEARTPELKEYQGIAVEVGGEDAENPIGEEKDESGNGAVIVNTDIPTPEKDESAAHEKGEGKGEKSEGAGEKGEGSGEGEEGEGEEGQGKSKSKGKGKKGEGEGEEGEGSGEGEEEGEEGDEQGQGGQGEGDEEEGEETEGQGGEQGDEEEEAQEDQQQAENNSEQEQQEQRMQQEPPPPQPESEVEQMDDLTLRGYQFKFQQITRLFFGTSLNYNTWGSDNASFKEIENLLKTGITMAIHDNVVKNYSEYPERELKIRKARALDLLGRIDVLMTTEFLQISDDSGNPSALRNDVPREKMEMYIICDRLAERLLPLFFVFRKELFNNSKLAEYTKFCLLYLGAKKRFLRINDWNEPMLETPNYDFYNVNVVAIGQESSIVFKKRFDAETNKRSFKEEEFYRVQDGVVVSYSNDRRAVIDLQMFIRNLCKFYFTHDKVEMLAAIESYKVLTFRAEMIVSYEMVQELNKLAFIKR